MTPFVVDTVFNNAYALLMNEAHPIEKWFSGKGLATVRAYVLPTLAEAERLGYWPKGASQKITAALNKQNEAIKFARKHERSRVDARYRGMMGGYPNPAELAGLLDDVRPDRTKHYFSSTRTSGHAFVSAMTFGHVSCAPELVELGAKLEPHCANDEERAALATARQWAADFAPIAALMERLDATRPIPTIVLGSLSPTVAKNVGAAMGVDFATVRMPEIEWRHVEVEIKGCKVRVPVAKILWPEGTAHNKSRFAWGSKAGNSQCHACGHAIKSGNFVPLVADTTKGPRSLWVGRDCARNLFAVEISGDADFQREPVGI